MGVGVVNHTSNIDSIIWTFCLIKPLDLELAKGIQMIEVGLCLKCSTYHCNTKIRQPMAMQNSAV